MFTRKVNETTATRQDFDFEATDRFNRTIGAIIGTYECDFIDAPPDVYSGYTIEPGHYYALRFQATRNGIAYGPIQPTHYFKTTADLQPAINKYLHAARKRALNSIRKQDNDENQKSL